MAHEAKYRYAAQLADGGKFAEAITAYEDLAADDYKDSATLVQETRYRRAVYNLYELGSDSRPRSLYLSSAYKELCSLSDEGYSKASEMIGEAQYIIYDYGQQAYYDGNYDRAAIVFESIAPYKCSDDYLTLANAHGHSHLMSAILTSSQRSTIADKLTERLIELFYFEDAADLIVSKHALASRFLEGSWATSGGSYSFEMDADGNVQHNLPWFNYGDYYYIEDGTYFLYEDGNIDNARAMYYFYLLSPNSMEVYCYKNGNTYTLYRQ